LKNSYSELHGIPTNGLVVDTRSHVDIPKDVASTKAFLSSLHEEHLVLCMKD
jgi:hypothetical protein